MSDEINAIEAALYARLTGGTALAALLSAGTASIYNAIVPPGKTLPHLVFYQITGFDHYTSGNRDLDTRYQIRASTRSGMAEAGSISDAVQTLLDANPLNLASVGWTNIWLRRVQTVRYAERDGAGSYIYHAGATYKIWIAK